MRNVCWGMFAATILMAGCAQEASGDAPAKTAAQMPPAKDDACGLLTLADIRRVLPEAARAERNDSLAAQGINVCSWYGKGKASVLDVSVWTASGADDTPMDNARTLAMGVADPTRAGAEAAVRLESVPGIGDQAVAMAEKADESRGILTTATLLTFSKSGRIVTVSSGDIARRDRPAALADLSTLGKAIAARL